MVCTRERTVIEQAVFHEQVAPGEHRSRCRVILQHNLRAIKLQPFIIQVFNTNLLLEVGVLVDIDFSQTISKVG